MLDIITIYSPNDDTNDYNSHGLGALPDFKYGKVTGGLTDQTVLTLQYPTNGENVELIEENKILRLKINEFQDLQRMRITSVKKSLTGRQYEIKAEPIFNDIRRYFIPTAGDKESVVSPATAFNLIKGNAIPTMPTKFQFISNLTSQGRFFLEGVNALEAFGGTQGSMLDTFGGEYIRDNTTLRAYQKFGNDNGTSLIYGKNITGLDMEINTENIIIGIYPMAKYKNEAGGEVDVTIDEKVLFYDSFQTFPNGRVNPVDFSDEFEDDVVITSAMLKQKAQTYMNQVANYTKSTPLINVKVDFLELSHFSEYYDFQALVKVGLGDTVSVYYPPLGVDVETRVIKYEYDVIKQQYTKLQLGQVKANFYNKLQDNIKDLDSKIQDNDFSGIYDDIQNAVDDASNKITGNKGGHLLITPPSKPEELLIMDTDNKDTAQKVLRLNQSGIGFSKNGYNGNYTTAWTIDGQFNADFITAGTLKAINIQGVNISGSTIVSDGADFRMTLDNGSLDWFRKSDNKPAGSLKASTFKGSSHLTYEVSNQSTGGGITIISPFQNTDDPNISQNSIFNISSASTSGEMRSFGMVNLNTFTISAKGQRSGSTNSKLAQIMMEGSTTSHMSIQQKSGDGAGKLVNVDIRDGLWAQSFGNTRLASLQVTGSKNSMVSTENFGSRLLNAYETPEYLFATYGKVVTDKDGYALVDIDPAFLETINTDSCNYHVFTSGYGNYNTWASFLESDRFTINTSEPFKEVSYNLVAYRKDYEDFYLETPVSHDEKALQLANKHVMPTPLDFITGGATIKPLPSEE